MSVVANRLSLRWYLGYDLHELLPDHSSLIRIRECYGLEIFRRFFERIVEMCFEAGLVQGRELYFEVTKVEANASLASTMSRSLVEGRLGEHLAGIFPDEARFVQDEDTPVTAAAVGPVGQEERRTLQRKTHASTVGSRSPGTNSGRWLGEATGE